jgi:steroid delta-isomerase-like uncharacterized protein
MSIETNKEVVRTFVERVFQGLDASAVDELVADDFESHSWPSNGNAKESLRAATQRMGKALADSRFVIEDLIGEDERVCVRLRASARQVGEFMGMPPSNRSYEIGEIHIFRVRDNKVAEHSGFVVYRKLF